MGYYLDRRYIFHGLLRDKDGSITTLEYIKGRFTGSAPMRGAIQTLIIGALAAGAAFLIAKWIS